MSVLSEAMANQVEDEILRLWKKNVMTVEIKDIVLRVLSEKSIVGLLRFIAYKDEGDPRNLRRLLKSFF